MLSKDELHDGIPFVLKLWDAAGKPVLWVQTLAGDTARYWYEIYRSGDWETLRLHAAEVFRSVLSESEMAALIRSRRCVVISTRNPVADRLEGGRR